MISIKSFNGFVSVDLTVLQKMKRHYLLPTILIYFGIGNLNAIVKSGAASPHFFLLRNANANAFFQLLHGYNSVRFSRTEYPAIYRRVASYPPSTWVYTVPQSDIKGNSIGRRVVVAAKGIWIQEAVMGGEPG